MAIVSIIPPATQDLDYHLHDIVIIAIDDNLSLMLAALHQSHRILETLALQFHSSINAMASNQTPKPIPVIKPPKRLKKLHDVRRILRLQKSQRRS